MPLVYREVFSSLESRKSRTLYSIPLEPSSTGGNGSDCLHKKDETVQGMPALDTSPQTMRRRGFELLKRMAEDGEHLTLLLDRDRRIAYTSSSVMKTLGYSAGSFEGWSAFTAVHPQDVPILTGALQHLLPGRPITLPHFRARHTSGAWVTLTGQVTHLLDDPEVQMLLIQLRPSQEPRDHHRAALRTITRALASTSEVSGVVQTVLHTGLQVMQADAASICLLSPDRQFLELIGQTGYSVQATEGWERFPVSLETPISQAVSEKAPLFLTDAEFQTSYPHIHAQHSSEFSSAAVLPLLIGDRILGILSLSFGHDRVFQRDDREFLQMVADLCAPALDRALMYREKERQDLSR